MFEGLYLQHLASSLPQLSSNAVCIVTMLGAIIHCLFLARCSIDKVPRITSTVLVIHGTEDEVIDFSHGLAIYERCPRTVEPLWVEGAGHNDVELFGQYLERLKQFINVELPVN